MAYTTAADVLTIVPELEGVANLTTKLAPFIAVASHLVDTVLAACVYTTAEFELIERWLAAHFYRVSDGQVMSETVGPLTTTYLNKTGYGLLGTPFGQQAILLDTSGKLSSFNEDMIRGRGDRTTGVTHVGTKVV